MEKPKKDRGQAEEDFMGDDTTIIKSEKGNLDHTEEESILKLKGEVYSTE